MTCISGRTYGEIFYKAMELGIMKKAETSKLKPTKGKDMKGGSTAERKMMAEKMEKAMTKKGEKNETKKSSPVNKVIASKVKK